MRQRSKSTGYRQHAWDLLQLRDWPSVNALAAHIGCAASGLRNYISGLEDHGYLRRGEDGSLHLAKKTGPRAPSLNINTGEIKDWNREPSMAGSELMAIVANSGLSVVEWLREHGFHPATSTRLRQMMNGQRPVSQEIEAAARMGPPKR